MTESLPDISAADMDALRKAIAKRKRKPRVRTAIQLLAPDIACAIDGTGGEAWSSAPRIREQIALLERRLHRVQIMRQRRAARDRRELFQGDVIALARHQHARTTEALAVG